MPFFPAVFPASWQRRCREWVDVVLGQRYTGHELDEPRRTAEFELRHDWNSLINGRSVGGKGLLFTNYSTDYLPPADDLVRYLEDFAQLYALNIR